MITVECRTLFDITATGVTGHYKSSRPPYMDADSWNRARNQQRNFETLQQIASLRTQLFDITQPKIIDNMWQFEFSSENAGVFGDDCSVIRADADGVPMLRELDNDLNVEPVLVTEGPMQNIWFRIIPINNITEEKL